MVDPKKAKSVAEKLKPCLSDKEGRDVVTRSLCRHIEDALIEAYKRGADGAGISQFNKEKKSFIEDLDQGLRCVFSAIYGEDISDEEIRDAVDRFQLMDFE